VCAVLINIYVTGLNQVFDVDIDKINKPYLPIAAGNIYNILIYYAGNIYVICSFTIFTFMFIYAYVPPRCRQYTYSILITMCNYLFTKCIYLEHLALPAVRAICVGALLFGTLYLFIYLQNAFIL
jgi:4-hydroxybenzoate polyprenyltransferase